MSTRRPPKATTFISDTPKAKGILSSEEFEVEKQRVLKMGPLASGGNLEGVSDCDWKVTAILSFFGFERFYTGHIGTGILKFFTGFGLGIWWLIDFISVLKGTFRDSKGLLIVKK